MTSMMLILDDRLWRRGEVSGDSKLETLNPAVCGYGSEVGSKIVVQLLLDYRNVLSGPCI